MACRPAQPQLRHPVLPPRRRRPRNRIAGRPNAPLAGTSAMNIEQARFNMIEQQSRPWDVLDPAVLELLAVVKREDFVPPGYRALAFVDTEVPLPAGQCMLAPKVEARLLQELGVRKHERVLEVGTGSGFMAALL